jgi:hypothetical protein
MHLMQVTRGQLLQQMREPASTDPSRQTIQYYDVLISVRLSEKKVLTSLWTDPPHVSMSWHAAIVACSVETGSVIRGAVPPFDFLAVILSCGMVLSMVGVCGRSLWAELWTLFLFLKHEA